MTINTISSKTNFTAGLLSENLFGRGDLSIYENGARTLDNVIIHPTGGISRRKGLEFVDAINSKGRLLSFEFNTEQKYLLCFLDKKLLIYKDDKKIAELDSPWTLSQLNNISYTQSADTLMIVNQDVKPHKITRNDNEFWKIEEWKYYELDSFVYCPYFNFYNNEVLMSFGNGFVVVDKEILDDDYIGSKIKVNGGLVEITSIGSPTIAYVKGLKGLGHFSATKDWEEDAFSRKRGYPNSVCFHQGRMVIGGSKGLPNRLWFSKSSDLFNFDLGTGLDDEAIEFAILSDKVNKITNVVSSRRLLVFTTDSEWMVSGEVLTPTSMQLSIQTTTGSYDKYKITPMQVNGATVFFANNGKSLREFLYTDIEQAYSSKDLTLLSGEILDNPIYADFSPSENVLYVILEDGTISCLTSYRSEEVNAWSKIKTQGTFESLAIVGADLYFIIKRDEQYFIEKFSDKYFSDCSKSFSSIEPKTNWKNLDIYENKEVFVIGDGYVLGKYKVKNNEINLYDYAKNIELGISYEHKIEPLPYMINDMKPYPPKATKVISAVFRIINSKYFSLKIGGKEVCPPLKKIYKDEILDASPQSFSGDVATGSLRWVRDLKEPLWSINSDEAVEFHLLSSTMNLILKR